jgi:hypothetical protein
LHHGKAPFEVFPRAHARIRVLEVRRRQSTVAKGQLRYPLRLARQPCRQLDEIRLRRYSGGGGRGVVPRWGRDRRGGLSQRDGFDRQGGATQARELERVLPLGELEYSMGTVWVQYEYSMSTV